MTSARAVRVLVCDDEGRRREQVRTHCDGEERIQLVGEASDGVEGVVAAARLQPDVILLGWQMPRLSGIEALPHLKQVASHAAVVMWSANLSPTAEGTAQAAGADAFLPKTATLEELTVTVLATADQRDAAPAPSVLLAHTSRTWRTQARATLDRVGARIREVESAEAAVECSRRDQPTVALIERRLIESLSRAELAALENATTIVIDDEIELEEALAALESGTYDDLLIEPTSPPEIASRIRAAGASARLRDQATRSAARLAHLAELSQTDDLTGLPNRRSLLEQLAALTSSARRHGRPLAVALLDIDRFKDINDAYGHQTGDAVLREVARRIAARTREEDVVGRLGGDEFLVLLAEADGRGAGTVATALRDAVERRPVRVGDQDLSIEVSVGWSIWQSEDDDELLERADRALYAAKRARAEHVSEATAAD